MESNEREESRSWPIVDLKQFLILFSLEKDLPHSQLVTNKKIFPSQKVMKNYELSNDQKISIPLFDILQGTVSRPFPRQYLGQIFP